MNLSVGIVGLPNVGKSTLFNALLKKQIAFVANYPFATIEPNMGIVPVPDERLRQLQEIVGQESHSAELRRTERGTTQKLPPIVPASVKFVDIAGLVKGANEGAGLGNKFLSHIREVSIIAHVVRAFEDENIIKEGSVDPKSDYETIQTELILADLATISKIKDQKSKIPHFAEASRGGQIKYQKEAVEKLFDALNKGIPARDISLTDDEKDSINQLFLLTAKPETVVLNVAEEDYSEQKILQISQKYKEMLKQVQHDNGNNVVVICAKIESELSDLSEGEQKEYLNGLGLKESGLERLIQKAYQTLGLISFLTAGEKEVRAWTIQKGISAVDAAGVIHTDFTKSFIKAEVVSYKTFVELGGWKKSRELGKARFEGRDYVMQDGDVVEFKIGS